MDYYNLDVAYYDSEIQLTFYGDAIAYNFKNNNEFNEEKYSSEIVKEIAEYNKSITEHRKQRIKDSNKANKMRSERRSKQHVYEYARANRWDYFCTFTVGDSSVRFDYDLCKQKLTKWLNNLKNRYIPELQYVVVPEQHKNGAWHFHALIQGDMNPILFINEHNHLDIKVKKLGFVNIQEVKDTNKVSNYITKYITKDLVDKVGNSQRYFVSKGLKKAEHDKRAVCFNSKGFNDVCIRDKPTDLYDDPFIFIQEQFKGYKINHIKRLDKGFFPDGTPNVIVYFQLGKE